MACLLHENPELMFSTNQERKSPYIITNNFKDQDLTQFLLKEETKYKVIVEGDGELRYFDLTGFPQLMTHHGIF